MAEHTELPWGVSVLQRDLSYHEGAMIVTPPPKDTMKRIQARQAVTSRRIALLEASHYIGHDQCVANAEFIVLAANTHDDLVAALQQALRRINYLNTGGMDEPDPTVAMIKAALAKAGVK